MVKNEVCSMNNKVLFLGLPPVLVYALKILWQFGTLVIRLCQLPKPDVICVQVRRMCFYCR